MQVLSRYSHTYRYFQIFTRGTKAFYWQILVNKKWLSVSQETGQLSPQDEDHQLIEISVSWDKVPQDFQNTVRIEIRSDLGDYEIVHLPVDNRRVPASLHHGFVESEGCVSIEAGSILLTDTRHQFYEHLPYLGRTVTGGITLAKSIASDIPYLEFPIFVLS